MAANPEDVSTLAGKLRSKGLSDAKVTEGLTGLGYSKSDAKAAVASLGNPNPAPATPAPSGKAAPKPGGKQTGGSPTAPPPGQPASPGMGLPTFPKPDLSQMSLTPPKKLGSGDVGGFLFGLLLYAVALNYIKHGPEGVKAWISAKFLNNATWVEDIKPSASSSPDPGSGLVTTRPGTPAAI